MEDFFYMREATSLPSVEEQQAVFRAAGYRKTDPERDRAYLDVPPKRAKQGAAKAGLPERAFLLRALRKGEGDMVNVAVAAVLAPTPDDALEFMRALAEKGAGLRVIASGLTIPPGSSMAPAELLEAIRKDADARRTAKARAGRSAQAARSREAQIAGWKLAAQLWPDAGVTVREIRARTGIPESSLYRAARNGLLPQRVGMPISARLVLAKEGLKRWREGKKK